MQFIGRPAAIGFAALSLAHAADVAPARSRDAPPAQSSERNWLLTFDEEVRYFSWRSSRGYPNTVVFPALPATTPGSGSQLYAPFALQLIGIPTDDLKLESSVRSGYVWSRQSTPGASGEVSTLTDTSLSTAATYYGFAGWQPFVSVNVNAPTGISALYGTSAFARMDADLVDIPTFGEGWNVGPTAGLNIALAKSVLASFGVGYTYRGPFDREGAVDPVTLVQGTTRLDPGDTTTINANLAAEHGPLVVRLSGAYTWETRTHLDGQSFYKSGDRYMLSGSATVQWNRSWSSSISTIYSHFNKNKVAIFDIPDLVVEEFNSNSNVTKVTVETTYRQDAFSIGPVGGYMRRDKNAWSPIAFQFLPAKIRWSAGGAAAYAITAKATLRARVEHVWTKEDENEQKVSLSIPLAGTAVPAISSTGWVCSLGGTFQF
jgi:hypothetical protein